jgi:hypothetical protein
LFLVVQKPSETCRCLELKDQWVHNANNLHIETRKKDLAAYIVPPRFNCSETFDGRLSGKQKCPNLHEPEGMTGYHFLIMATSSSSESKTANMRKPTGNTKITQDGAILG